MFMFGLIPMPSSLTQAKNPGPFSSILGFVTMVSIFIHCCIIMETIQSMSATRTTTWSKRWCYTYCLICTENLFPSTPTRSLTLLFFYCILRQCFTVFPLHRPGRPISDSLAVELKACTTAWLTILLLIHTQIVFSTVILTLQTLFLRTGSIYCPVFYFFN